MSEEQFIDELKKINIYLNEKQKQQLHTYYELLIEWNKKMNLTGITEKKDVYLKHFYDSLTICKIVDLTKYNTLADVGTGAGFPGMVIKIVFPNLKITLIDSLQKRLNFLEEVINTLQIKDIELVHSRVEEYALTHREIFDIVTARAVAPLNILCEYCIPMVKEIGYFVPLKANIEEELSMSLNAFKKLFIHLENKIEFKLPIENSNRTILLLKKVNKTPKLFPRKYSEIKKTPL